MPCAAAFSQAPRARQAVDEASEQIAAALDGGPPDLSLLFVSRDYADELDAVCGEFLAQTSSRCVLGCAAEAVAAGAVEIESGPALSALSTVLPGAAVLPFHVQFDQTPDGPICAGLPDPPADPGSIRAVILLGDPYSCSIPTLVARLAGDLPGVPLLGGMASGGQPGENLLSLNGRAIVRGGVGVVIERGPPIRSVVSQGCRPIGAPFVVTRAEGNLLLELGGRPALARLEETYSALLPRDRQLIRQGLHVGLAMDERRETFSRGDFLISNALGADRESGAIAIGSLARVGQTVQFHVRDAETADEDLRQLLADCRSTTPSPAEGALLFSCNGRGTRLFPEPNHDASVIQELCGPLPLAGFFAQGELGPVGGRNYIHGFTASVALFGPD